MLGKRRVGRLVWLSVFLSLIFSTAWAQDTAPKVAVLPFVIHGQENAANAQKALDEVFSQLGSREGMKLIEPQEVRRAAGGAVHTDEQARAAGHRLGAAFALHGSFIQIGNSISLDAKLVDVSGKKKTMVLFAEEKGMENLAAAVGKIVQQMSVSVLSKAVIGEIKVQGNDRIEAEAIKGVTKSKKGELLKADVVSEDIRAIHKMGFFEKVDAEVSDSPAGKILTFVVQENPTVQEVKVTGQKKIKEKDIMAAIASKPYTVLQRNVVAEDVQKIMKLYQQKGYYNAEINSSVTFPKDPRKAVIAFTIKENKKVYIKRIDFTGNKHFSARKLRGVMQTKRKSILSLVTERGILQRDILETDTDRVTAFYHDEGYMDAKVSSPEVVLKEDGFHITLAVEEGERYKVTSVQLTGDMLENYDKKITKKLQLKPKAYFSREKVRADIDTVTKAYMNEGYARAEIDPRIRRHPEDHTTDITFNVTEKEVVRIGQIFVTGNTKTRDNVIRRELKIAEGETFSAKKIQDSITRLKKLDYFEEVDLTPTDTEDKTVMNLHVRVKEKLTGSISLGGGYSSDDGLFTSGTIMQKNLFGKGQYIALKGYLGQEAQRYMMSFTEPWMFGYPVAGGIDIYNWIRAYQDFTKDAYGFRLRAGVPVGQWSRFNVYYTFENAKISDLSEAAKQDPVFVTSLTDFTLKSSIAAGFERDTTDHPFLPTRGTYASVMAEWSSDFLGSDSNFFRHEYKVGAYQPLFWKFIGHLRGMAGFMYEPDGSASVPYWEHFYLGGIDTLRGFEYARVGPKDAYGVVVGGDKYAVATAEVLFPLYEKYGIRGVVFFDAGNAFAEGESLDISKFRTDVGAGVRWNSPFGPLRIEIGYNLDKQAGEDPYQWQFSAGAFF